MKKLLIVLTVLAMASFLFTGCTVPEVPEVPEEEDEVVPTEQKTVAPIITTVPDAADGYVNEAEAADGIVVNGTAPTYSEVKVYIDGICAGTADTTAIGTFSVVVAKADLGADGAKTLYATAKEADLAESAKSNEIEFTLDTVAPKIKSSNAKASTAAVIADVDEVLGTDTKDKFDNWTVNNPALLVGGIWKLEIKNIIDTDASTTITVGDTITLEVTDPSGTKTLYTWGYPNVGASVTYTTFIPGVAVDFPEDNIGAFNGLTFGDIGAEVYVLVTPASGPVAGYIDVTFDEAVTGASILAGTWITSSNWWWQFPSTVTVRSATVARLLDDVVWTLAVGDTYTVICSGISDLAGNTIPATAPSTSTGIVMP